MKRLSGILIGAMIVVMVVVGFPRNASACDCDVPDSAAEGLERSDAVFAGKVVQMNKARLDGEMHNAVLIDVGQIWKGIDETQIIVYTSWSSCQFDFREGEQYLLYSYKIGDRYFVMNCGRSTAMSHSAADLEQLGAGHGPGTEVHLSVESNQWQWYAAIVVAVIAAIAILFARAGKR